MTHPAAAAHLTAAAHPVAAVHPAAIVVNSATPLWYATRATGLVALVLLTISMILGTAASAGYSRPGLPRFVTADLHRNSSLLALAFTVAHILTTLADGYAPIRLTDVVVPFVSAYRPLWLGLGAIAFDLMIALTVTSLLRTRMSRRTWLAVHWTAYACWPVAVLHGLGTGTDTPVRWVLLLTLLCVAAVTAAAGWRLAHGWPSHRMLRLAGAVAVAVALLAGGAWLAAGPLRPGWARRAGTPPSLLHDGAGRLSARIAVPAHAEHLVTSTVPADAGRLVTNTVPAHAGHLVTGMVPANGGHLAPGKVRAGSQLPDPGPVPGRTAGYRR